MSLGWPTWRVANVFGFKTTLDIQNGAPEKTAQAEGQVQTGTGSPPFPC